MPRLFTGPEDKRIKRALCIVAHPDDIEFYCAGVVLMMTGRGVVVDFVLATSGDKGARDTTRSRTKMAQIRERDVVFTVEDFGYERQETLSLRKREVETQ